VQGWHAFDAKAKFVTVGFLFMLILSPAIVLKQQHDAVQFSGLVLAYPYPHGPHCFHDALGRQTSAIPHKNCRTNGRAWLGTSERRTPAKCVAKNSAVPFWLTAVDYRMNDASSDFGRAGLT
jgi:hypothetical protein